MADASTRRTTARVRLRPDELAAWHASAASAGMTLSDWVRAQIGGAAPRVASPRRAANAEVALAVNRWGNNINQLARYANSCKLGERIAVLAALRNIERELERIARC